MNDQFIAIFDTRKQRWLEWHVLHTATEEEVREWARMFPHQIYFFLTISQEV